MHIHIFPSHYDHLGLHSELVQEIREGGYKVEKVFEKE